MFSRVSSLILITVLAAIVALPVAAFTQKQKLVASDGTLFDAFGSSVALDGDTAIIGATRGDENVGSAYVFTRDASGAWTEQQKLLASDGADNDIFGFSVALEGDTAIITAVLDDRRSGSAYVFTRDASGTWTEQQKLLASDGDPSDLFGFSVALDGDTAVIGPGAEFSVTPVYVFTRDAGDAWTEQQKLLASDGAWDDHFGRSLGLDGDTVIIGAEGDDDRTGSAYVFTRDASGAWTEQQKLLASDGAWDDHFGASVTLDGDTAIIGAPEDDNGLRAGSAYVFTRDASGVWTERQKLLASDGADNDIFGRSVGLDGDTVIIGAPGGDDNGFNSGSAYEFMRGASGAWTEQQKLLASDGAREDRFGWSLSLDGDTATIGAFLDDDNGDQSGSAYVFTRQLTVDIDIKPKRFPNSISPYARGVIPVAILGSDTFDLANVDETTLAFGPDAAPIAHRHGHFEDVNLDGILDLVLHFRTQETGIACGDESATFTGETLDGQPFEGTDSIETVGCRVTRRPAIWMRDQDTPLSDRRDGPVNIERK